jgi:hypothetical protein
MIFEQAKRAVIRVGDGRGFVVAGKRRRLVITAGHCLPGLPSTPLDPRECTYPNLLGRLGEEPSIQAHYLFADLVADIAVLGPPDYKQIPELLDDTEAYQEFVEQAEPLAVGEAAFSAAPEAEIFGSQHAPAWLLSLDGRWISCRVQPMDGPLWIGGSRRDHRWDVGLADSCA